MYFLNFLPTCVPQDLCASRDMAQTQRPVCVGGKKIQKIVQHSFSLNDSRNYLLKSTKRFPKSFHSICLFPTRACVYIPPQNRSPSRFFQNDFWNFFCLFVQDWKTLEESYIEGKSIFVTTLKHRNQFFLIFCCTYFFPTRVPVI